VGLLLVLIELYSLAVTAEVLGVQNGLYHFKGWPVDPKFQVEGVAPTNHSSFRKLG